MRLIAASIFSTLSILLFGCGGGGESIVDSDPNAVALVAVSASANTVTIGKTLQLTAQAVNAGGAAISGKTFTWASSATSVATVSSDGLVTALSLGTFTITASVAGKIGGLAITVIAQVPVSISYVSGASQSGSVGTFIGPKDPSVKVLDASGSPVAAVSVTFTPSGGGAVSAPTVVTDATGTAAVRWQLGPLPAQQTLRADAGSLTTTLSATATALFKIVAGNNQTSTAGTFVGPRDPAIQLTQTDGTPVVGASITFTPSPNGSVSASPVSTNEQGVAAVRWQLSSTVGTNTLTARAGDSVVTLASVSSAPPASISVVNGSGQSGSVADFIGPKDPGFRVLDANGAGVAGVVVTFTPSNGGLVSAPTVITDAHGDALVRWKLGPLPMQQSLRADAGSLTSTLTASARAKFVIAAGNNQSGPVGTFIGPKDPAVVLSRLDNVGVGSASIQFTPSGNGIASSPVVTNPQGVAALRWQLSTVPGTNTLTVRAGDSVLTLVAEAVAAPWSFVASGTDNQLEGVWGFSPSDVWVVGDLGTILHYNGTTWVNYSTDIPTAFAPHLISVWGASPSDIWAVGYDGSGSGSIVHYDGTKWSGITLGARIPPSLHVWGTAVNNVWAVGGTTILHYNGALWTPVPTPGVVSIESVWGSSASDVWAVGGNGTILHYDGVAWSTRPSPTTQTLLGVWGTSSTDVWATGYNGTILHFNGVTWSVMPSGTSLYLSDVWGSSASDVWITGSGGTILHYNGSSWSSVYSGTFQVLSGVWGSSASDVWAVGDRGTILHLTQSPQ